MDYIRSFLDSFNAESDDEDDRRKKKAQIIYSGSVQNQSRKSDGTSVRRAKSSVNARIDENEVLSTYTNIDSPTRLHESDSAFGSGFEDNDEPFPTEHRRLRRVESRERIVGSEQYVVVDFIGNLDVKSTVKKPKPDDESPDSTALSVSPTISVHSAFEEISTSDVPTSEIPSPVEDEVAIKDVIPRDLIEEESPPVKPAVIVEADLVEEVETVAEQEPTFDQLVQLDEPMNTLSEKSVDEEPKIDEKPKYKAAKGLKNRYEQASIEASVQEKEVSPPTRNDPRRSSSHRSARERKPSPSISNRSKRSDSSASNSSVSSVGSYRKTSLRSNPSDASTKSIVMQNKLLFDKQIAEENKRKYGSMTSLEARPKKVDTSIFERNNLSRSSFNNEYKQQSGSAEDFRMSGIVAGTRNVFEGDRSRSITGLSFKKRDPDSLQNTSAEKPLEVNIKYTSDKDISNIANKGTLDSGSIKKKKKGIFKKKKKHEGSKIEKEVPNEDKTTFEIETSENTEDRKRRGLLSLIRKRSKSSDSEPKTSKQNSIEVDISTDNDVVLNDSAMNVSLQQNQKSLSKENIETLKADVDFRLRDKEDYADDDIKVSADLENNLSIKQNETEKSFIVSVQNEIESVNDDGGLDITTDNQKDVVVDVDTNELQNDLQAIANRQSSNRAKKKNVFKKKKKHKNDSDEDLLASAKIDVDVNHENEASINIPETESKVPEVEEQMQENIPELSNDVSINMDQKPHDVNPDPVPVPSVDTVPAKAEEVSIDPDVIITPSASNAEVETKSNTIGELVFERPDEKHSDEGVAFVVPQISVTEENTSNEHLDNLDVTSSPENRRLSIEGSDDELVRALDLANNIPNTDDTTSYVSNISTETASTTASPKKKKKFPFHIKGSSKKEKRDKKDANGDVTKLSVKSSKKNKRPKSLDLSNTDLSLSSSNLDVSELDSPAEKSKKKRIGIFRSKKKKEKDSPTKLSPDKAAKPLPGGTIENSISQNTLLSSDEFTIPENGGVSLNASSDISVERRKSDGSEYSKQATLIEIQRSEELQF